MYINQRAANALFFKSATRFDEELLIVGRRIFLNVFAYFPGFSYPNFLISTMYLKNAKNTKGKCRESGLHIID